MLHLVGNESASLSTGLWIAQVEKRGIDAGLDKRLSKIEVGNCCDANSREGKSRHLDYARICASSSAGKVARNCRPVRAHANWTTQQEFGNTVYVSGFSRGET
jgi:hypothetical protein